MASIVIVFYFNLAVAMFKKSPNPSPIQRWSVALEVGGGREAGGKGINGAVARRCWHIDLVCQKKLCKTTITARRRLSTHKKNVAFVSPPNVKIINCQFEGIDMRTQNMPERQGWGIEM